MILQKPLIQHTVLPTGNTKKQSTFGNTIMEIVFRRSIPHITFLYTSDQTRKTHTVFMATPLEGFQKSDIFLVIFFHISLCAVRTLLWQSTIFIILLKLLSRFFKTASFVEKRSFVSFVFVIFTFVAIFNSAYQCTQCLKFCHKQCCKLADSLFPCTGIPDSSVNQEVIFTAFPVNHTLGESTYAFFENFMKPSFLKRDSSENVDPSTSQSGSDGSNGALPPVDSAQHLHSFRVRPSQAELDDDDDDYDDIASFESNSLNLSQGSDFLHPLRRSTFLEGSPAFDQDYSSLGQDDSILSYPGFFTVIVQQAMNLALPAVPSARPLSHRTNRKRTCTANSASFPGEKRSSTPISPAPTTATPTGTATTTCFRSSTPELSPK